ncbi:MAG TPA: helix-turn-helix domain-containing protein [Pyrinomonadaceae bacterium]|nr:helix-turn-helix domain-containing protein [Pyrinomonadaceae bacterium]
MCKSKPIQLTPKQFDLLLYFVKNAGRITKKSELLDAVWADTFIEENTLARNVSWLRKLLEDGANGEQMIETVPKLGYRFIPEVTQTGKNAIIIEEETVEYTRGEETITFNDKSEETIINKESDAFIVSVPTNKTGLRHYFSTTLIIILALTAGILTGAGFVNFYKRNKSYKQPENIESRSAQTLNNAAVIETSALKIGSVIHLKSGVSNDAGYLDVWGEIKNKAEFNNIPTQIKFVSTHQNPNRENGSGSWKIVSARGKKDGEPLLYGDKIHLQSTFPDAGFLDNCGWIVDMGIFKAFVNYEKFAVFTTAEKNRDRGTGTWTVGSNSEFVGNPVLEGHSITLENGFPGGGYLNAQGFVVDIPAYNDYDGTHLVFIRASTPNPRPPAGNWIITNSKFVQ